MFIAVANQFGAMSPDIFAMLDILPGELFGGGQRQRLLFRHGLTGMHRGAHLHHGVDGIDCSGSRFF
jgi:hypothetical protein